MDLGVGPAYIARGSNRQVRPIKSEISIALNVGGAGPDRHLVVDRRTTEGGQRASRDGDVFIREGVSAVA